jgi:magnesium-protoporphyrin O-methyltransferase
MPHMDQATPSQNYDQRRGQIETYFDRTASDAWARLTSDAPVSGVRKTVREGRDRMRANLLDWLPEDLTGKRILDAGCGTGALAREAAGRGAHVVAIDVALSLVDLARDRSTEAFGAQPTGRAGTGRIDYLVGDMLDPSLGTFDHVVAMDSLIHYRSADMVSMLARLAERTGTSIVFTFAPRTPALSLMHAVGRLFPRQDRAPAIEPVDASALRQHLTAEPALSSWEEARSLRIDTGFYKSYAMELVRV